MSTGSHSTQIKALFKGVSVIPVLQLEDTADAQPLARALVAAGLPVLEVTLRTQVALECIEAMAHVHGVIVGAGTVLTPTQLSAAKQAGARFAVSPGATPALITASKSADLPLLPGAATASEVMALLEQGYDTQKFFPAEAAGGVETLKAIGAPIPQVSFCPTGGITPQTAPDYLALENVICVGGSWIAPPDLQVDKAWDEIARRAEAVKNLAQKIQM